MNHPYNMNDFGMDYATTSMVNSNMNDVHISAGNDVDLLYFRNPMCVQGLVNETGIMRYLKN